MKKLGIRTKILIITLVTLFVGIFFIPGVLQNLAESRYSQTLNFDSNELLEELAEDYTSLERDDMPRVNNYFILLYDNASGQLIREGSYFPPKFGRMHDLQNIKGLAELKEFTYKKTQSADGKVTVVVAYNNSAPREFIDPFQRDFFRIYLFVGFLVVVGVLLATTIAFRPVKETISKVSKLEPLKNLDKLKELGSNDEVGKLIKTFNNLLEKTHLSSKSQKQFVENASHELKTPLTSLNLQLEKLANAENIDQNLVKGIRDDVSEIEETLESLLLLSEIKKTDYPEEPLNLTNVISDLINDRGYDIEFVNTDKLEIVTNLGLLKIILNNLISNSIKFKDTKAQIKTCVVEGVKIITVEDDGDGILLENYDLIFNPFFQEDESRTRGHGGSGLGLSIVKAALEKLGWKIEVSESSFGGAKFTVFI